MPQSVRASGLADLRALLVQHLLFGGCDDVDCLAAGVLPVAKHFAIFGVSAFDGLVERDVERPNDVRLVVLDGLPNDALLPVVEDRVRRNAEVPHAADGSFGESNREALDAFTDRLMVNR